nr:beta-hexosaminidase 2 [Quercus suber]
MWLKDSSCEDVVRRSWDEVSASSLEVVLIKKLDKCQENLRTWNRETFGLVRTTLTKKLRELSGAEEARLYVTAPDRIYKLRKEIEDEANLVLGGEVSFWFEQVDPAVLNVGIWPRASATVETLWSRNRDETGKKRYAKATDRLNEWRYRMVRRGKVERLVENNDEALSDLKWVKKLVMVAILCIQDVPSSRPSMREVIHMLEGIHEISTPPCPFLYSSTSEPDF